MLHIPEIHISDELRQKCPNLRLGCMLTALKVGPSSNALEQYIDQQIKALTPAFELDQVSQRPEIRAAREAYKALGKKPGRYRPSAEALLRRTLNGKGLYHICNVVDLLNCISLQTGYSIGGYDHDQIKGEISLGIGEEGEPYDAVGRGVLNIANLPILRDTIGAFGSPTSDSVRTSVTDQTNNFLMVIFDFNPNGQLEDTLKGIAALYQKYANAEGVLQSVMS